MQIKDAWWVAYKNFLHVSYFGVFLTVLLTVLFFVNTAETKGLISLKSIIATLIFTVVWYYLAQKFKKREKSAVSFGYIFLIITLVLNLISGINIIVILISLYFLYLVYKASKSSVAV